MEKEELKEYLLDALFKGAKLPLRLTPGLIGAIGFGAFISFIIENNPRLRKRLKEVKGKVFLFEAKDIKKSFYLSIGEDDIKVLPHSAEKPDVVMRGEVRTLLDVLLGREDPDTVFFSRKLEISGDTAAAVHFKNILASVI